MYRFVTPASGRARDLDALRWHGPWNSRCYVSAATRILIVDDDRSIRRTLEKFLAAEGYAVTTAQDAPGAIAAAGDCDLMLLDLGLPGGSGFDVITPLAHRERKPTIVVVTARDDMQST